MLVAEAGATAGPVSRGPAPGAAGMPVLRTPEPRGCADSAGLNGFGALGVTTGAVAPVVAAGATGIGAMTVDGGGAAATGGTVDVDGCDAPSGAQERPPQRGSLLPSRRSGGAESGGAFWSSRSCNARSGGFQSLL